MSLNIPREYEAMLDAAVLSGAFTSKDAALMHALDLLAQEQKGVGHLSDTDIESIQEGIIESDAGLGTPLEEFDAEFRKKNGFSPKGRS